MHLANPSAIKQYEGLKHTDDKWDAFWLAHLKRLDILPEGYIYPKEERPVRDLLRRRLFSLDRPFNGRPICFYWITLTNFMGFLPIPRFRIYLGTSSDLLCVISLLFYLTNGLLCNFVSYLSYLLFNRFENS